MTLAELNALEPSAAAGAFSACLAAPAWVARMVLARPFASRDDVIGTAESAADEILAGEWAAAIAHHPRIGEAHSVGTMSARAGAWSAAEQAGVGDTDDATRAALARGNAAYEARFGHTFIVCATGKSAGDVLAALVARLSNDPITEQQVTAGELREIARLRLARLFADT